MYVRATEFVDGLIVITHHAKIVVFARQQTDQLKLRRIRILILIHHNIAETILIRGKHLFVQFEQFHSFHDQIIKIQCIILL